MVFDDYKTALRPRCTGICAQGDCYQANLTMPIAARNGPAIRSPPSARWPSGSR